MSRPQALSGNGWPGCVTLIPSPASRPKTSPACVLSSSPSSRPPWCTEEPPLWKHYICNILILLSEALHVIGLIMLSSFGPNLLSLELIIVCDCMFLPSTVFSLAFREVGRRRRKGGKPPDGSLNLCFCALF